MAISGRQFAPLQFRHHLPVTKRRSSGSGKAALAISGQRLDGPRPQRRIKVVGFKPEIKSTSWQIAEVRHRLGEAGFEDGAGLVIEGQRPTGKDIASLSAELDRYASDILLLLEAVQVVHRMRD